MDKFSKMKRKEFKETLDKEDVLYSDKWVKIFKHEDWTIIKETDNVFCIIHLIEKNQFVIRQEYIPSYKWADGQEHHLSLVGGGVEIGETPEMALLREIQEEAGFVLRENFNITFEDPLYYSKSNATKCWTAIISLTENDYNEIPIKGDGSMVEKMSSTVKLDIKYLKNLKPSDLLTDLMLLKFKNYLNI